MQTCALRRLLFPATLEAYPHHPLREMCVGRSQPSLCVATPVKGTICKCIVWICKAGHTEIFFLPVCLHASPDRCGVSGSLVAAAVAG